MVLEPWNMSQAVGYSDRRADKALVVQQYVYFHQDGSGGHSLKFELWHHSRKSDNH